MVFETFASANQSKVNNPDVNVTKTQLSPESNRMERKTPEDPFSTTGVVCYKSTHTISTLTISESPTIKQTPESDLHTCQQEYFIESKNIQIVLDQSKFRQT